MIFKLRAYLPISHSQKFHRAINMVRLLFPTGDSNPLTMPVCKVLTILFLAALFETFEIHEILEAHWSRKDVALDMGTPNFR